MHWTYDELLALPVEVYEELVEWVIEARATRSAEI
jgi:hypothetical protein